MGGSLRGGVSKKTVIVVSFFTPRSHPQDQTDTTYHLAFFYPDLKYNHRILKIPNILPGYPLSPEILPQR